LAAVADALTDAVLYIQRMSDGLCRAALARSPCRVFYKFNHLILKCETNLSQTANLLTSSADFVPMNSATRCQRCAIPTGNFSIAFEHRIASSDVQVVFAAGCVTAAVTASFLANLLTMFPARIVHPHFAAHCKYSWQQMKSF
jgi:hypothetical protein